MLRPYLAGSSRDPRRKIGTCCLFAPRNAGGSGCRSGTSCTRAVTTRARTSRRCCARWRGWPPTDVRSRCPTRSRGRRASCSWAPARMTAPRWHAPRPARASATRWPTRRACPMRASQPSSAVRGRPSCRCCPRPPGSRRSTRSRRARRSLPQRSGRCRAGRRGRDPRAAARAGTARHRPPHGMGRRARPCPDRWRGPFAGGATTDVGGRRRRDAPGLCRGGRLRLSGQGVGVGVGDADAVASGGALPFL